MFEGFPLGKYVALNVDSLWFLALTRFNVVRPESDAARLPWGFGGGANG